MRMFLSIKEKEFEAEAKGKSAILRAAGSSIYINEITGVR